MDSLVRFIQGMPIYITTEEYQRRRHRKKRINKKWRKRYGVIEINKLPHGEVICLDGILYMTKKTFMELKGWSK